MKPARAAAALASRYDEIQPFCHKVKRKKSMKISNQTINRDGKRLNANFEVVIFVTNQNECV